MYKVAEDFCRHSLALLYHLQKHMSRFWMHVAQMGKNDSIFLLFLAFCKYIDIIDINSIFISACKRQVTF